MQFRNLIAVVITLVITLIIPIGGYAAAVKPEAPADFIPDRLRSNIAPQIDRLSTSCDDFLKHLSSFKRDVDQFKGKPLNGKQQGQLGAERNQLNQELDSVRRNLEGILQKLRESNKLTPELDGYINAYLRERSRNAELALQRVQKRRGALNFLGLFAQLFNRERTEIENLERVGLSGGIARHHAAPPAAEKDQFVCDLLALRLIVKSLIAADQPSDANIFATECAP